MSHYGLLVFDIEANGLYHPWEDEVADRIHCIAATDHLGAVYVYVNEEDLDTASEYCFNVREDVCEVASLEDFNQDVKNYEGLACHNMLHYDLPMLNKFIGLEYDFHPQHVNGHRLQLIDTLVDSRWLYPDRPLPRGCPSSIKNPVTGKSDKVGPHGLMAWSFRTSGAKPIVHDWRNQPLKVYIERCIEDAKNNLLVFNWLNREMAEWYKCSTKPEHWKVVRAKAKTCVNVETAFSHVIFKQIEHGVGFNKELADSFLPRLDSMIEEVRQRVEPKLPSVPIPKSRLNKDWKFPSKCFNGDGKPSANMMKFLEKHDGLLWTEVDTRAKKLELYGKKYDFPLPDHIKTHEELTLYNSTELKKYLMELGWKPVFWNYKKDPNTKRYMRDDDKQLIPTTPRIKDQATGMLCPNLVDMGNEIAEDVVLFNSLKHRRQTIESTANEEKGYLNHPRLSYDGRLPAMATPCGTASRRVAHRVVANVPKAEEDIVFGKELRSLFYASEPDYYFVGYDASAIEARLEGNEAYPFDSGEYAKLLLEGDIHCYSGDTELLTEKGWIRLEDFKKDMPSSVIQYHPESKQLEFTKYNFVTSKPSKALLFEKSGMLVTDQHRMLVESHKTGKSMCILAKDLCTTNGDLRFRTAGHYSHGERYTTCFQKLLVACQADGSFTPHEAIRFEFKKERKVNRLKEILNNLDMEYSVRRSKKNTVKIYVKKSKLTTEVVKILGKNKILPWKGLTLDALKELEHWDGTKRKSSCVFDSTCKNTVENMHTLATLCNTKVSKISKYNRTTNYGKTTTYRIVLNFDRKPVSSVMKENPEETFLNKAYCVQVPSTWVLTRRKGKCVISGNTSNAEFFSERSGNDIKRGKAKGIKYACLPIDNSQVLTKEGWKFEKELKIGQEVVSYNIEKDCYEWDIVLAKHYYKNAETIELKNKWFSMECTPNHRWFLSRRAEKRGSRYEIKEFREAKDINQECKILQTSILDNKSDISCLESEFLGWLLSDGHYKWSDRGVGPSSSKGKRRGIVCSIDQDKRKFYLDIKHTLDLMKVDYTEHLSNKTMVKFLIKSSFIRGFLMKLTGEDAVRNTYNWTSIILKMGEKQRKAFLNAFWKADGTIKDKNSVKLTQKEGAISEAVITCCNLLGYRVSVSRKNRECLNISANLNTPWIAGQKLTKNTKRKTDVFCITTNNGTFVTKQGNNISITGNSVYGAGPGKIATMLDVPVPKAKEILEEYWEIYWAVTKAKNKLVREWNRNKQLKIKDIMGGPLWTRSEHSLFNYRLQNAGTSVMKLSAVLMYQWLNEEIQQKLANKVIDYHDEAQWEVHKSLVKWKRILNEEEGKELQKLHGFSKPIKVNNKWFVADSKVGKFGIQSIKRAGEILRIKVPLDGEWCCGKNWSQTH